MITTTITITTAATSNNNNNKPFARASSFCCLFLIFKSCFSCLTTEDKLNNWREKEFVFDFISEAVEEGPVYFVNTDTDGKFVAAWDASIEELVEY